MLLVAITPRGDVPMISPTSLPFLASECTQQPTSSSSGCSSTPLIAATPTDPVAHCTTRRLMNTSPSSPADTESHFWRRNYAILCLLAPEPSVARLDDVVGVLGVAGPDGLLVVLAHAGARNFVGKGPTFGQPPPNDLVRKELSQLVRAGRCSFIEHDDG